MGDGVRVHVGPRSPPFSRLWQIARAQAVITTTHRQSKVQTESMDFDRLGEAIADRLNAVAPSGIHIRYQADGILHYTSDFEGAYGNTSTGEHLRENLRLRPGEPFEAWAREVCAPNSSCSMVTQKHQHCAVASLTFPSSGRERLDDALRDILSQKTMSSPIRLCTSARSHQSQLVNRRAWYQICCMG
jgi:hypothetical protein